MPLQEVHKEIVYGTVMDERGKVLKRGKFLNVQEEFERFFRSIVDA